MQGNFYFVNCLYVIETDHGSKNKVEIKTTPDIGKMDGESAETCR